MRWIIFLSLKRIFPYFQLKLFIKYLNTALSFFRGRIILSVPTVINTQPHLCLLYKRSIDCET